MATRFRNRIRWWDVVLRRASAPRSWSTPSEGGDDFTDRATSPTQLDIVARRHLHRAAAGGDAAHHRLDRAGRSRSLFIAYAYVRAVSAAAVDAPRLSTSASSSAICSSRSKASSALPVDVSSSLIILFTIYGAFLQHSGAGKFFIDFSMALMGNKPNSAGRTVVLSSFLLGGPSGSGVATTVTIGAVAYPMMQRAGFEKNAAGGLLAAGGLGAIISPPVLGAAAFLIAEFLKISYLDVIWMATIPTCLYYLSLLFMVELDAKRFGARIVDTVAGPVALAAHHALRLPLPVADLDHRLHAVGLFADAVGVLVDGADLRR